MRRCSSVADPLVAIARTLRAGYGVLPAPVDAPELPCGKVSTVAQAAVRELFRIWGLDREHAGSARWNPLGDFIRTGARVVLKPNWVLHWNQSGQGIDCLLTHWTVIEAVLDYVALAQPGSVVVGDAPVQGCDFDALRSECFIDAMIERSRAQGLDVGLRDFRRTLLLGRQLGSDRRENARGLEHFVSFDLAGESLLEALATDADRFRVTMYNPDLLRRNHAAGRHRYLIAREIIDADIVLNLPKLKCHKKAGITGALKNLVGISGNKEFLPHHRKGGSADGGDCYAGRSRLKRIAEEILDFANRRRPGAVQSLLARSACSVLSCAARLGADRNLEGSWYGNDTVWRTCLDLQRILAYGCADGSLAAEQQRLVLSITDAIIAGEGDGPLAPTPVEAGLLTGAANPAAIEWVHAWLIGFDPERIPLVRHAFDNFRWPLATFAPDAIRVCTAEGERGCAQIRPLERPFRPPDGWRGHCEASHDLKTHERSAAAQASPPAGSRSQ